MEFREFDVGGVPKYAQIDADSGPSANFAEYGAEPDKLPGASSSAGSGALEDPDAANGAADDLPADGPDWLFGVLSEEDADTDDGQDSDGSRAGDYDLLEDVAIPGQTAPADAPAGQYSAEVATDKAATDNADVHKPNDDAAEIEDDEPENAEAANDDGRQEGGIPDEAAEILATELGLDIDEARLLVNEALADEIPKGHEATDEHDDTETATGGADAEESAEDVAETDGSASTSNPVMSFLRSAASKTGSFTRNEARIFAEGAQTLGGDLRAWNAGRPERVRERALNRTRKDVEKEVEKWTRYERHRGKTSTEAPRGTEDR